MRYPPSPSAPPPSISTASSPSPRPSDRGFPPDPPASRQLSQDEILARTLQAAEDARFAAESARRRAERNVRRERQGGNSNNSLRSPEELANEVREAEIAASFAASVDPPEDRPTIVAAPSGDGSGGGGRRRSSSRPLPPPPPRQSGTGRGGTVVRGSATIPTATPAGPLDLLDDGGIPTVMGEHVQPGGQVGPSSPQARQPEASDRQQQTSSGVRSVSIDASGNVVDPSDPSAVSTLELPPGVTEREFEEQLRIENEIAVRNSRSNSSNSRNSSSRNSASRREPSSNRRERGRPPPVRTSSRGDGGRDNRGGQSSRGGGGGGEQGGGNTIVPSASSGSGSDGGNDTNRRRRRSRSTSARRSGSRPPSRGGTPRGGGSTELPPYVQAEIDRRQASSSAAANANGTTLSASARSELERRQSRLDEIQARSESRLYSTQMSAEEKAIARLTGIRGSATSTAPSTRTNSRVSSSTSPASSPPSPRASSQRQEQPLQLDDDDDDTDEALAQRVARELAEEEAVRAMEQQFRDEDLARSFAASEAARASRLGVPVVPIGADGGDGDGRGTGGRFSRFGRCHRMIGTLITASLVGVILFVVFGIVYRSAGGDPDNLPPWFGDAWGDGWEGTPGGTGDPGEFQSWGKTKGQGLTLTLVNALTEEWWDDFEGAVYDWDNVGGAVRPLALSTVFNANGPEGLQCSHRRGAIKVCNGNWGQTDWTGLNIVIFENGWIVSSIAQMNEFYLRNAGSAERRYVMCHEIGHGFGLPHRDEIATNKDLGTCMDYTVRPQNNLTPDEVDFQNLADLYGEVGRRRRVRRRIAGGGLEGTSDELELDKEEPGELGQEGGEISIPPFSSDRPYWEGRGRLLHRSDHGEVYEADLGGGRTMVTRILF